MKFWAPAWIVFSLACAEQNQPERILIRPGGRADARPDMPSIDHGLMLVDMGTDMMPDSTPSPSPERAVWIIEHPQEDPQAGLRSQLVPAHRPSAAAPVSNAALLVTWAGPDTAPALLNRLSTWPAPVAPYYKMTGRTESVTSDVSWLVAHSLSHPNALKVDGRPVLVLAPPADGAGLNAARRRLDALVLKPWLVIEVPVDQRPLPTTDALLPQVAYGTPLDSMGMPGNINAAHHRQAARAAAQVWLPRASPLTNTRGSDAEAPVWNPMDGFIRSLILARRATHLIQPIVVVDGLGAWADDRQIDAVQGEASTDPESLTAGHRYLAYGTARQDTLHSALQVVGETPTQWHRPVLVYRDQIEQPAATAEGTQITVTLHDLGDGSAEWALWAVPFVLDADHRLHISKDDPRAHIDLVFADHSRLSDHIDLPTESGSLILAAFVGRIVDSVVLVYTGDASAAEVSFSISASISID